MQRVSEETYFMILAQAAALRSTCPRRQVGACAEFEGEVVATGYNGSMPGAVHCIDPVAEGGGCLMVDGNCLRTIHAEDNCIGKARGRAIGRMFVTTQPCLACCKTMLAHRVKEVVFLLPYPSATRDAFLEGIGMGGWMRQINGCPILDWEALGGLDGYIVRSDWGACVDCGHVFVGETERAKSRLSDNYQCAACHNNEYLFQMVDCPYCTNGWVNVKSQYIGMPVVVTNCLDCKGRGQLTRERLAEIKATDDCDMRG